MKKIILSTLFAISSAVVLAPRAQAQVSPEVRERVQASYLIAFGRSATDAEVAYWAKQKPASVSDLVANHRNYLSRDTATHRDTIKRAYNDALGRNPTEAEIKYWSGGNDTYMKLMQNHVSWLAGNPAEYDAVIKRSYKFALGTTPNADAIHYWKSQGTLSYVMLVACHQDWKRRNAAGKPSGKPAIASQVPALNALPVSPAIAHEARAAGVIAPGGGNVISPGGANVIAPGGGNVIAVGAGNVIAAGGLN